MEGREFRYEHDSLRQEIDRMFDDSDMEVIRILSLYLTEIRRQKIAEGEK